MAAGPEKAPESTGQAGKPELPQPEPAVTPGDANIVIPESKDVAPEVKVAPPKGDAGPPAPSAPFSFFGGGGARGSPRPAVHPAASTGHGTPLPQTRQWSVSTLSTCMHACCAGEKQ